jgi:hypothetical protein
LGLPFLCGILLLPRLGRRIIIISHVFTFVYQEGFRVYEYNLKNKCHLITDNYIEQLQHKSFLSVSQWKSE